MLTTTNQRWVQINKILHIRSKAITTAEQRKIGKTVSSLTLLHVLLRLDLLHFSLISQVPIFNLIFGLLEILLQIFMLMVGSCSRTTFFYPRLLAYTSKKCRVLNWKLAKILGNKFLLFFSWDTRSIPDTLGQNSQQARITDI